MYQAVQVSVKCSLEAKSSSRSYYPKRNTAFQPVEDVEASSLLYVGVSQPFQPSTEIREMSFLANAGVRNSVLGKRKNANRHNEWDNLMI